MEQGFFYIIQLMPEEAPQVYKFGYSTDPARRIKEHQITCPTAVLVKQWACLRSQEFAAIDYIARKVDGRRYSNEVFASDQQEAMVQAAEVFFDVMKPLARKRTRLQRTLTQEREEEEEEEEEEEAAPSKLQPRKKKIEIDPDNFRNYLSAEEVAAFLEITVRTVQQMMEPHSAHRYAIKGCKNIRLRRPVRGKKYERRAPYAMVAEIKQQLAREAASHISLEA